MTIKPKRNILITKPGAVILLLLKTLYIDFKNNKTIKDSIINCEIISLSPYEANNPLEKLNIKIIEIK